MTSSPAELLSRHRKVMPSWLSLYYDEPLELVSGEGRHVRDGQGTTYLDFFGGILTTSTGYNVPEVVDAIREQAAGCCTTSTLYLIRPMIELAERIAELSTIPDAKVFFVSSGTEAVETALVHSCSARGGRIRSWHCETATTAARSTAMSVDRQPLLSAVRFEPLDVSLRAKRKPAAQPLR